jgi:hypothetical protein
MRSSYIVIVLVFDSSTLILLARAEMLDVFLGDYRGEVRIPRAVETECCVSGVRPDAILIRERVRERRIRVEKVQGSEVVRRLRDDFHLGHGEAEAVALALERQATLVATDDRNAMRACGALRLAWTTAMSILVRATEKGLVPRDEALGRLDRLAGLGRSDRRIVEAAARQIGGKTRGQGA